MIASAAPPKRLGAQTSITWRDETVVAELIKTFDELWAQAQWVAASDRLVIEMAVVDQISVIRAGGRCATLCVALEVDLVEVEATLTYSGTATGLARTEVCRRYGPPEHVSHQHTRTGGVACIMHPLRQPPDLPGDWSRTRGQQPHDVHGPAVDDNFTTF